MGEQRRQTDDSRRIIINCLFVRWSSLLCAHAGRTITNWNENKLPCASSRFVFLFSFSSRVVSSRRPDFRVCILNRNILLNAVFDVFFFFQCSFCIVCSVAKTVVWESVRTPFFDFSLFDVKFDWIDLCRCTDIHTRTRSEESMEEKCFPVDAERLHYINGHRSIRWSRICVPYAFVRLCMDMSSPYSRRCESLKHYDSFELIQ